MEGKKKVVILGSAYPLRGGGIATFNERLAQAYTDNGFDTEIITFSLQYPSILFPGKTQISTEEPPKGLKIKVMVNSINPFNWIKVGRYIKKMRPDIVIVRYWIPFMGPCLGTIARIVRRNKHTKVEAIVDNILPHERNFLDTFLSSYFVRNVDGFITMSKSVLNDLKHFTSTKPIAYTLHPLYDNFGTLIPQQQALQELHLDPNYSYVLFFGFIRDYKGLDLLIEAFADSKLRTMPVKLLVAGEFYVKEDKYLQQISRLQLEDKVVLHTRFIPNAQVSLYFSAAHLIAQPYKSATQSGVTQIAYHFEKPIVTTNVGGLAEIVSDGKVGFVVNPDSEEIAQAIIRFFEENLYDSFHAAMQEEKKRFSWDVMVDTINKISLE
ncbi:MAG: glycosyltransferase [Bacteroidales bacterium]|nr:glycosyltransferase [Bacteroidales bacterium]